MKKITIYRPIAVFETEQDIENNADILNQGDWYDISNVAAEDLSREFLKKFSEELDWYNISIKREFSEEEIREFQGKVNWFWISRVQKMSMNFIEEFKDKILFRELPSNSNLSFSKEFVTRNFARFFPKNSPISSDQFFLFSKFTFSLEEIEKIKKDNNSDIERLLESQKIKENITRNIKKIKNITEK